MQAQWRGYCCRQQLQRAWAQRLRSTAVQPQDLLAQNSQALTLFLRAFDAQASDAPAQLAQVCQVLSSTATDTGRLAFTSHCGDSSDVATLQAARLCVVGLQTLRAHQAQCLPALQAHMKAQHQAPTCQQAQCIAATLALLLTPGSWPAQAASQHASPEPSHPVHTATQRIAAHVAAHQGFDLLASLLLHALPPIPPAPHPSALPAAAEEVATALVSAWPRLDSSTPPSHAWVLMCVPQLLTRAPQLSSMAHELAPVVLQSLGSPDAQLQSEIAAASTALRFHKQNEAVGAGVAHCALTLHSNLLHILALAAASPLSAQQALNFTQVSRVLVALTPPRTREQLVHASARSLSTAQDSSSFVLPRAACCGLAAHSSTNASTADEAFGGSAWYLPQLPQLAIAPASPAKARQRGHEVGIAPMDTDGGTPGDAADGSAAAHRLPCNDSTIQFAAPLTAPALLNSLAAALLQSPAASAADAETGLQRASDLCLWVFMLVALCSADDAARQQLEVAWTAHALPVVHLLWHRALCPALMHSVEATWQQGPLAGTGKWVLPLTVLCSLYANFVSTASDEALFSNQVRAPALSLHLSLAQHMFDNEREAVAVGVYMHTAEQHRCLHVVSKCSHDLLPSGDMMDTITAHKNAARIAGANSSSRDGPPR